MNVIDLPIKSLKPYKRNPRKNDKAVEYVANSIRQFGFKQPIVIDENYEIVCGHTRWKAAKTLGMESVPCIMADDLDEDQIRAFRLADNKTAEMADWDFDLLEMEFNDIDPNLFDMSDFGFFQDDEPEQTPAEIVEDDAPELDEVEPCCKRGQIWVLGCHRLMCGDSTSAEDVARLMNGEKADMVFTDPPYGYEYQSNMRVKSDKFDVLENDDKILNFFPCISEVSNGFVFICTIWKVLDKWLSLFKEYYELTNMIIWDKGGGYIGDLEKTFGTDYEIILCSNNGKNITGKRIGSVWKFEKDNADAYKHPTQKPVKLSANAIISTTKADNIVLDAFGGSGSTLIACEQLDRKCFMMEISPRYCDVIIKRWEDFTGQKAVLLEE